MNDLPQAPEGLLDPDMPWSRINPNSRLWMILKARLTGRPQGNENYSSYVNISEADADRLIANMKKDPRGYPSVDQGGKYGGIENQKLYQEWLVEEYLERPFREETNKKIDDAAIEARLKEIQEEKIEELKKKAEKDKETVPLDRKEEEKKQEQEQEILDSDQQAIEDEVSEITTELDSVSEEEKKADSSDTKEEPQNSEEDTMSSDVEDISKSLNIIRGSLQTQVSDLGSINTESTKSLSALEGLKQLFQAQTDIIKREVDLAETKSSEKSLEQSQDVSGSADATSTMDSGKAEGVITNTSPGIGGGVNVLTVKPTEGEFSTGQTITQGGGGGFDLMGMIKGIAGKFGGGKGGGGSPIKMSQGGFLNSPYPSQSMAQGGFAPGVYDKPTRGNLLPGQAVIPMNRNVGKKIFGGDKEAQKKQQPLIDTMSQPLKAVGLAILTTAGNFLSSLGPLAGFFLPYAKGLVSGFSKVLGVPIAIIESLLGGPAYAAAQEQDKQQNVFAKLWAEVMKKFGFGSGDEEKDKNNGGESGETDTTGEVQPQDYPKSSDAAFKKIYDIAVKLNDPVPELTAAQAMFEGGWLKSPKSRLDNNPFGQTGSGTAGSIFSDGRNWARYKTLEDAVKAHIYRWATTTPLGGSGYGSKGGAPIPGLLNILQKYAPSSENNHSEYISSIKEILVSYGFNPNKQNNKKQLSAESGINNSLGKMLGWSVIDGPNSGYPVGDNLTMHGKEAYLQHEKGMSILPIENNKYSLSKNPVETLDRWKEIIGSSSTVNSSRGYESGGRRYNSGKEALAAVTLAMQKRQQAKNATKQRERLGVSKSSDGKWHAKGVTAAAVARPWWQMGVAIPSADNERLAKQEALAKSLAARLNKEETPTAPRKATALISQSKSQKPTAATAKTPEKTEIDLMMEQYNILTAAGKHSEAKELGMQIWNKTWRKKGAGIERIPTTPISATATQAAIAAAKPSGGASSSVTPMVIPIPSGGGASIIPLPINPVEEFYKQRDLLIAKTFC